MNHPMVTAQRFAADLQTDLIAASQIKEHISPNRLREILDIQFSNDELLDELEARLTRTPGNRKMLEKLTSELASEEIE